VSHPETPLDKIEILRHHRQIMLHRVLPNVLIASISKTEFLDMLCRMASFVHGLSQKRRELGINQKDHAARKMA
jgi:hypothetical protein